MESESPSLFESIFALIVLALFLFGAFWLVDSTTKEISEYEQFKEFCSQRPSFCYCSWLTCEFKTSWSSITGFSNDTLELCNLATKLNDKKTLFEIGCP